MSTTQDNALTLSAERVAEVAKDLGAKAGLQPGVEATTVLERALAIAWCDVFMWKGANDTQERFDECVRLMRKRITEEMIAQRILRRGHAS